MRVLNFGCLFLIMSLLFSLKLSAQFIPTANLTIFSEDANKFYVILNGERQNDKPETNIRLEELPQPYYNCKIIFEDKSLKDISKNMLMLTDANGIPQDVTYKIKKDKNGKPVLRFFSFIPAEQNMIRPSNCAVYRFGNPSQVIAGPGFVQQTTTVQQQTRGGNNGNGVGLNVNVGGVNVNVNANDLFDDRSTTTTTTTTTIRNGQSVNGNGFDQDIRQGAPQGGPQGCNNAYPMAARDFQSAKSTIQNEGFDETRLDIAKQVAGSNCLNTTQISELCALFSFEESKLDFAKFAFDHCTDPRNYFKISNKFTFSTSKQELNQYIQGR